VSNAFYVTIEVILHYLTPYWFNIYWKMRLSPKKKLT